MVCAQNILYKSGYLKIFFTLCITYLRFVLVTEELVAKLALDVLYLEVGRINVTFQMVGLHEAGATLRAEIRPERNETS